MNQPPNREGPIVDALLAMPSEQRGAYLEQACAGDFQLRQLVLAMLQAHERGAALLDRDLGLEPQAVVAPSLSSSEKPGDHIGRYKLLQKIGEGGCGIVYMAEQETPVKRKVALKVIKLGMDTRSVVARFEAERQALALMDHPNIAKVLDAGATDTGRPYFVMELVRGTKITNYCDEQRLSMHQRLDLFTQVCQAVQHAHQKGIIHRDLKPSNILVTERDGQPVPKVIDFGIAKATGDLQLTDKTLFTAFEQFIGTPAYMSPEQARLGELDIDTRSDIYSLGVLLYELLTGRPPFETKALIAAGVEEMLRTIRDKEPAKPSTRMSSVPPNELTTAAQSRNTEPLKLMRMLRGDLDWIVMKCLEKDRARRYETANAIGADLRCYLADEPVVACPPSILYRFQKLVRRNRLTFGAAGAVVLALLLAGAFGIKAWQVKQQQLVERRENAVEKALLTAWYGDLGAIEESVRDAEQAGVSVADLRMLRGLVAMHRGDYQQAVQHLEQAWKLSPKSVAVCSMLINAYTFLGQWAKAQPILEALDHLTPTTPEDFLFKGSLEALLNPAKGLEMVNEAMRRRPTGVAGLVRGSVRASVAHDSGRISDAEAAIADINAARTLLPPNAETIAESLKAHLIASGIYEDNELPDKRAAAWRQVEADAAALEQYPSNQSALLARGFYLKLVGGSLASFRELSAAATNGWTDYLLAVALYRDGQFEAGLQLLQPEAASQYNADYIRGYFLAELPHGPQLALKEFYRICQRNPSAWDTLAIQTTLRLLGRKEEAMNVCREARQRRSRSIMPWRWRQEWYERLLDYNCGDLTEHDLLKAAEGSRYNQSEAHFFIALTRLAEGDRSSAREHFRASVTNRVFHYLDYDWSKTFLARMERDPNWPPWIPAQPEASK